MNSSKIITRGIEVIALLFAAFNGFFTNWAPPTQQFSKFSFEVGLISVSSLVILLIVVALSHKLRAKRSKWYLISIPLLVAGIVVGLLYKSTLTEYVIEYPKDSVEYHIIGDVLTPDARKFIEDFPNATAFTLIENVGIKNIEQIWTRESINSMQLSLSIYYIAFVLLLVTSLFTLAEGKLSEEKKNIPKQ